MKKSFPIQACRNAIDGIRNEEIQQQPLVALRSAPNNRRLIPGNRGTSGLYVINCRRRCAGEKLGQETQTIICLISVWAKWELSLAAWSLYADALLGAK